MDIQQSVAVVTGAGAGIGAAIARALVERGASVVVADLDAARVEAVARELNSGAAVKRAVAISGDVSSDTVIAEALDAGRCAFGPIDLYVANAGTTVGAGIDTGDDAWQTAIDVNLLAHVRAARALVPEWVERGRGYFISTASAAGLLTQIGSVTYSVTKHAVVGFAEWLSITYGDSGIGVSCLCPMGVNTDLLNAGFGPSDTEDPIATRAVRSAGAVLEADEVATGVMEALDTERFLVLPHSEVAGMYQQKGSDYERWLTGMRRYQRSLS